MKLTALAAVLAGSASFLQVSAAPLRILLVTSSVSTTTTNDKPAANNPPAFEHLRIGHPAANPAGAVAWLQDPHAAGPAGGGNKPIQQHRPCRGGRKKFHDLVKAKTLEITNFFRAAFGLPLKEHHRHGKHHKHGKHHDDHDHHRHGKDHHHHKGPEGGGPPSADIFIHHGKFEHEVTSFGIRLHQALMSLGPWEGRAMAFVLGCGIGVLLRMFWVFAVVMIRIVGRGRTSRYTPVAAVTAEDLMVPPPIYVFEDVKTPVVVGDVKVPVVVEEEVKKTVEDESK